MDSIFILVIISMFVTIISGYLIYKYFVEAYLKRKNAIKVLKSIQKIWRG